MESVAAPQREIEERYEAKWNRRGKRVRVKRRERKRKHEEAEEKGIERER